ncbi:MAG TPA: undecaprenyl-phosphate glucose phosphotransferase [Candidatus Sulfotelmatobacter sp.]|nr:undecaprenyl-phosphate glucose phosphotransferase [Candidatus Sulfotelmatobacter sp.]
MQTSDLTKSPAIILGVLRMIDAVIVISMALLANELRNHSLFWQSQEYLSATMIAMLLTLQVFHVSHVYNFRLVDHVWPQFVKVMQAWAAVWLVLIAIAFFTKTSVEFSRIWAGLWFGMCAAGFLVARIALKYRLAAWRQQGKLTRNIVLIGAGDVCRRLVAYLQETRPTGVNLLGVFEDRQSRVPNEIGGLPLLGNTADLLAYARQHPVDQIIVTLPWRAEARMSDLLAQLRTVAVDVRLCPDGIGFELLNRSVSHLAGLPMLNVFDRPLSGWNYLIKGIEDRILASLMLILFLPLFGIIALAIRLDSPGPILFRQKRYGFNNNVINILKFRTMQHEPAAGPDVVQAKRNDPRVTRVGALLRRTSFDELPQLLNVLRGEMSLVGPRPHAVSHNVQFAAMVHEYFGRHRVKPGITGWAQVHGLRGEIDNPEKIRMRVQYDLYYIDNWSLLFDLSILLRTLFVGLVHENAY